MEPAPPATVARSLAAKEPAYVQAAQLRATEAADLLGSSLKEALVTSMKADGPLAAATICAQDAGSITASVAEQSKATVGRSSLRLRSPANAAPRWVQEWLDEQGERSAEGVRGFVRTTWKKEDRQGIGRVLRPLVIEPPCLACHGEPEQLAPGVAEFLAKRYPGDKATGYALGELRGALYAEAIVAD